VCRSLSRSEWQSRFSAFSLSLPRSLSLLIYLHTHILTHIYKQTQNNKQIKPSQSQTNKFRSRHTRHDACLIANTSARQLRQWNMVQPSAHGPFFLDPVLAEPSSRPVRRPPARFVLILLRACGGGRAPSAAGRDREPVAGSGPRRGRSKRRSRCCTLEQQRR
jgi:hypothetical protein